METPLKDVEYDAHVRLTVELGKLRADLIALEERYYELKDQLWYMKHPGEASDAR